MRGLEGRIARLETISRRGRKVKRLNFEKYRYDPVSYAYEVHGVRCTPQQEQILKGLITPPYRVYCPSANTQGKSFIGAIATQWWFDTRNPSIALTTAPTEKQVIQILWGTIRAMREKAGLGDFPSAVAPRLATSTEHWADGITAKSAEAFQGRHSPCVLIIIDEAIGVSPEFFPAAESMLNGIEHAFLMLYNPTDGTSHIRRMEDSETGLVVRLSALEHPNIIAERQGLPAPYPSASRLDWVETFIRVNSDPVQDGSEDPTRDIEVGWRILPDGTRTKGQWFRPSGEVEARVAGRWPTQSEQAVWSENAWLRATTNRIVPVGNLQIGVDVALDGPDKSAFAVQQGGVLRYVQAFQGWHPTQVHQYARDLAWDWGQRCGIDPKRIPIAVDDIGCGGSVMALHHEEHNFVGFTVSERAYDEYHYPNKRSELAFGLVDAARDGHVYFGELGNTALKELKSQFLSMRYVPQGTRRVLLPKKEQKKLLGRSPDDADAVMLAYARLPEMGENVSGYVGM